MSQDELRTLGLQTIKELEDERGILASGREEIYGCIFGRDSLITTLKLIRSYEKTKDPYLLSLSAKILRNITLLQGKEVNIESGEEPGKIIHEYRENNHEHLTARGERPWFLYPDGTMRNFDTIDATPLFLIAISRFYRASNDEDFLKEMMPAVERALTWLKSTLERDERGFLSYSFPPDRKSGGLTIQNWMDSFDSVFHEDGSLTPYPIAPAEVQAYAYLALRLWGLDDLAYRLKARFNELFVSETPKFGIAFALDGAGKPMTSLRSSIGHILWASEERDSILYEKYIPELVSLILSPEIFEPEAGIRTLSKLSNHFDPKSYHNGSIWPHDTAIIAEGLNRFGFDKEAEAVRESLIKSWEHFQTPIELFVFTNDGFAEYLSPRGQKGCTKQAWSAASLLAEV